MYRPPANGEHEAQGIDTHAHTCADREGHASKICTRPLGLKVLLSSIKMEEKAPLKSKISEGRWEADGDLCLGEDQTRSADSHKQACEPRNVQAGRQA